MTNETKKFTSGMKLMWLQFLLGQATVIGRLTHHERVEHVTPLPPFCDTTTWPSTAISQ